MTLKSAIVLVTSCPHCRETIVCDERNTSTCPVTDGSESLSRCYKCGLYFFVTVVKTKS